MKFSGFLASLKWVGGMGKLEGLCRVKLSERFAYLLWI